MSDVPIHRIHSEEDALGLLTALCNKAFIFQSEKNQSQALKDAKQQPCICNKMFFRNQMTLSWHVNDLKPSHMGTRAINEFLDWVTRTHASIKRVK